MRGLLGIRSDNDDIIKARAEHHKKKKDDLLAAIRDTNHKVKEDFELLPVMHLKVDKATLAKLLDMPLVSYVGENSSFAPKLSESLPLVSATQVQGSGFGGSGTSVAVLDSSINYTLSMFGGCTSPGLPSGCKVAYVQDFVSEGGSLADTSHGTNVSGIIVGVAPDAKVLGLNVYRADGLAYENDVIRALQWVLSNRTTYNIVAVNISFGVGKYSAPCTNSPLAGVIGDLTSAGIAVTVASGNDGYSDALSYPACVPGAISVGAVYDATIGSNRFWQGANCTDAMTLSDQVACFSNSASFLAMLAPGSEINAANIPMSGTSQAAPHVAGAVALLKSKEPQLTVDDVIARLTATGAPVIDIRNGTSKPRLDVSSALSSTQSAASDGQGQPLGNGNQPEKANPENGETPQNAANPANSNSDTATDTGATALNQGGIKKADSQIAGPGWHMAKGKRVTHEQAMAHLNERAKKMKIDKVKRKTAMSAMGVLPGKPVAPDLYPPEIMELARALRYDPKQIYDYVHNNIDYVPYYGSLKGDVLTYLDGSGNDFDQASLMISLLRASGYSAQYVYGSMIKSPGQYANWLGVDNNWDVIWNLIYNGGIPFGDRVWVKANIGGVDYVFDPAFKTYTSTGKINISSALGYSQSDFLAGAQSGATQGNNYVQNVNEGNIKNKLTTYSINLANTIRSQYPNKSVEEIVGGRSIDQSTLTQYTSTLPNSSVYVYWDEIPSQYITTVRIQHAGIDYSIATPDLNGQRLTITYAGADNHPELRLDGQLVLSGSATTGGSKNDCILTIDHPYADSSGTYQDQTVTYKLVSGSKYAIVSNFGGYSDNLILKRQKQLDNYQAQGMAATSEPVLGETLNLIGLTWLKELMLSNKMMSEIAETLLVTHHQVGMVAQEAGYYIDVKAGHVSLASRHGAIADEIAFFKTSSITASAFEHGVLEQMAGSANPAVSTMKLFQIANATGRKVFNVTAANYASVKPQLINYTATELNDFQTEVNNGKTLILPDNGRLALNSWKGKGYLSNYFSDFYWDMGMIIGGNYYGGYASYLEELRSETISMMYSQLLNNTYCPETIKGIIAPVQPTSCGDPVDMASGAYFFDNADLSLGGSAPLGLSFARSYTSSHNQTKRSLGFGWSHNNDAYLASNSDAMPLLGRRQPVDAASFIAAQYVIFDLMKSQDNMTGWVAASLASKWAIDQTIDNAITLQTGNKTMEFIKLADGTFSPPPGITSKLVNNGNGTFSLVERFGMRTDFDTTKRVSRITDVDGNVMTFSYSGNKLSSVRDAVGRTLTLGYDASGRITSVTDSTGRVVSYGYDTNGDLTTYIDPENKSWQYGYAAQHLMTTMTNPLNITSVTNSYDSYNRVKSQLEPRSVYAGSPATYNFYFSGYKSMREDPNGQLTTFFYDAKGREYAEKNALGQGSTKVFDGQDHVSKVYDPRGYLTNVFTYDGNHNVSKASNDPAFGPIWAYDTTYIYDPQFRLTDSTDHNGHTTHYDYDARHHLTLTRDGVGNTSQASYNGPYGLRDTAIDGKGTVTTFTYDAYGNPQTQKTGSHPQITYTYDAIGRLTGLTDQVGSLTTFEYDKRGLLTRTIDPSRTNATIFEYYDDGKLWKKTDRNGSTITYSYSPSGKLERIQYPDNKKIFYFYNSLDQLEIMGDSIGVTEYTYDAAGRLSSFTNPYGFTVSYAYDASGNVTELTYPGDKKVNYSYDAQNRLKTVGLLSPSPMATYTYKANEKGPLIERIDKGSMLFSTTYGYDSAHRLTSLYDTLATYEFTLDANGNRTSSVNNWEWPLEVMTDSASYTYNGTKNRLLAAGANGFGYDSEGQLSSGYGSSYTFDYEHRLTAIGGVAQFSYDGAGNRLQAVRNGVVTRYIYDAAGNMIAEADGNNTITRYYVYGLGLLAMVTPDGQRHTYTFNGNGSTVATTDDSLSRMNHYTYGPFGDNLTQYESIPQPFKYVGQYGVMAEPNGLYYMKARYYDPKVGRFISEDPLGFEGGDVNLSAYVLNNPVNMIDPEGKSGVLPAIVAGAVVSGGWYLYNHSENFRGVVDAVVATIVPDSGIGTVGTAVLNPDTPRAILNLQVNKFNTEQAILGNYSTLDISQYNNNITGAVNALNNAKRNRSCK